MRILLLLFLLLASCAQSPNLRDRYGIPHQARKVLVLGQSAHLDLSWQKTMADYYDSYVAQIFREALEAIAADPDYRYAICEIGYLRLFLEKHPERAAEIVAATRRGQLQIVGGGVSSPDVLLPLGESLLRDYIGGYTFLDAQGIVPTTSAWLPDSFGLSPATPDLFASLGLEAVAFWRADGAPDVPDVDARLADFAGRACAPGSTAAALADDGRVDFLWEGPRGGRVFAHWLRYSYLFGDYLDYQRVLYRDRGAPVGTLCPSEEGVLDNLEAAVAILEPVSSTDYLFLPVGGDFQYPKKALAAHARAWNAARYPQTGVWVHAGTFDDYAKLAMTQAKRLPVRRADMTPYWMGFTASRPKLKEEARLGAQALLAGEALEVLMDTLGVATEDAGELALLWWAVGKSNHHDWVTGTSVDAVTYGEQLPETATMRRRAEERADEHLRGLARAVAVPGAHAVVYNPSDRPRDGLVLLDAALGLALEDDTGAAVPTQALADGRVAAWVKQVPAFGYLTLRPGAAATPAPAPAPAPAPGKRTFVLFCAAANTEVPCGTEPVERIVVQVGSAELELAGGALTRWQVGGESLLAGPSLGVLLLDDSGGLYAFQHENGGPPMTVRADGLAQPAQLSVVEQGDVVTVVRAVQDLGGTAVERRISIFPDGTLEVAVTLAAPRGTTALLRLATSMAAREATMAVPGGVVSRPSFARNAPTFWAFERWFALGSLGLSAPANPAVSFTEDGVVDLVLLRNSAQVDCLLGACGSTDATHTLRVRLGAVGRDRLEALADDAYAPLRAAIAAESGTVPARFGLLEVTTPGARVSALRRGPAAGTALLHLFTPLGPEPVRIALGRRAQIAKADLRSGRAKPAFSESTSLLLAPERAFEAYQLAWSSGTR